MIYLPPFTVQGTYLLTAADLEYHAHRYRTLLDRLSQGDFDVESLQTFSFLNDWLDSETGVPQS
jgi:glutathione-regulated potassium-efflux system ancillary protein KefG